jgi:uncharacterized protein (DUF4415 family)
MSDDIERKLAAEPEPDLTDPDNPEWTEEMFARARPAKDVLPPEVLANFKRPAGRPRVEEPKVPVSLRLSPRVVAYFKGDSPEGWQKRVAEVLEAAARRGS